jgi:hypothetical protein
LVRISPRTSWTRGSLSTPDCRHGRAVIGPGARFLDFLFTGAPRRRRSPGGGSSHSRPQHKHVEPRSRYRREFVAWPEQVSFFLAKIGGPDARPFIRSQRGIAGMVHDGPVRQYQFYLQGGNSAIPSARWDPAAPRSRGHAPLASMPHPVAPAAKNRPKGVIIRGSIPAARGGKWSAVQVSRLLEAAGSPFEASAVAIA